MLSLFVYIYLLREKYIQNINEIYNRTSILIVNFINLNI
jgi:hypothetical protein